MEAETYTLQNSKGEKLGNVWLKNAQLGKVCKNKCKWGKSRGAK